MLDPHSQVYAVEASERMKYQIHLLSEIIHHKEAYQESLLSFKNIMSLDKVDNAQNMLATLINTSKTPANAFEVVAQLIFGLGEIQKATSEPSENASPENYSMYILGRIFHLVALMNIVYIITSEDKSNAH